jgi:hypothetical protein
MSESLISCVNKILATIPEVCVYEDPRLCRKYNDPAVSCSADVFIVEKDVDKFYQALSQCKQEHTTPRLS